MKNKKNKIKHRSEETEEDKRIIDIICKLGGVLRKKKITKKNKKQIKYKTR